MLLLKKKDKSYCWIATRKYYIHSLGLNMLKNMEYESWVIYAYFNIFLYVSLFFTKSSFGTSLSLLIIKI